MTQKTVYLRDYTSPVFEVLEVSLTFDIQTQEKVIVKNKMHLRRKYEGLCELQGEDIQLLEIFINDKKLSQTAYTANEFGLTLLDCPDEFHLSMTTQLNPKLNTTLSGLYASRMMLCTQCEAEGFRRITYYFDRPDVLSRFTTKIIADRKKFPYLLSNGNLIAEGAYEDGRDYVVWEDPFLKPSYLFALVAGNLVRVQDSFKTCSSREIGLDIFVENGDEHLCSYAMQAIKNAMRWDEERFGREYDLERYMVVAVKDFNMGAMENKGLNIFNSKYVLADANTATDEDILGIESVIGHEYFHNWTGNRVTCRDWFQLSLKEGLTIYRDQSFSGDMNDLIAQRIMDVSNLRRVQFPEDRGALAHPVQPKSYQEINNFYTATVYEKGGEIVRMYEVILGRDGFRKGMDLYFERHDGQAVTIEDFLAAMADANHMDLTQFKRWYDESGTPVVKVAETIKDKKLVIELEQFSKSPLLIPIRFRVYDNEGKKLDLPDLLLLKENKQIFEFDIPHQHVVVNYLQGFSAPIILKRELGFGKKLEILKLEQDGFALWDLKQSLFIELIQNSYQKKASINIPQALLDVLKDWIKQERFSFQVLAELFSIPSFEECLVGLTNVDPVALEESRLAFEKVLALALANEFKFVESKVDFSIGERAWNNLCLHYQMITNSKMIASQCMEHFRFARNMTDRIGGLRPLVQAEDSSHLGKIALEQFFSDWQSQELVMDKWFALQARYYSLEKMNELLKHPLFHWENPNKVRALIGTFTQNPIHFHAKDGSGYEWLVNAILTLDKLNPQVAARMVTPLTRWDWLDSSRQKMIWQHLSFLMKQKLSPNVYEMVSKSIPKH